MSLLQGIVLAVVQGLTEFLPVSSTAHLILVPWLFGWQDPGLTYDVALHAGTLLAVLVYFARDWIKLLRSVFLVTAFHKADNFTMLLKLIQDMQTGATGPRVVSEPPPDIRQAWVYSELLLMIVIATVPAAVAGYFLESYAGSVLRGPPVVAGALIAVALLMGVADRRRTLVRRMETVGFGDAVVIGLMQAVALVPGTSRAGITIAAGMFRNLTREAAARFSFMLATPIIAGATVKKAWEVWQRGFPPGLTGLDFAVGFLVAAVTGYAAIAFLLRYLEVRTLKIFVAYRLALGVIIIGVEFLRSTA